jgi:hypothetical protein
MSSIRMFVHKLKLFHPHIPLLRSEDLNKTLDERLFRGACSMRSQRCSASNCNSSKRQTRTVSTSRQCCPLPPRSRPLPWTKWSERQPAPSSILFTHIVPSHFEIKKRKKIIFDVILRSSSWNAHERREGAAAPAVAAERGESGERRWLECYLSMARRESS